MKIYFITILSLLAFSLNSIAESTAATEQEAKTASVTATPQTQTTLKIEGMHCKACEKMIHSKVCDDPQAKENYASCQVKLIDAKKQIGELVIQPKDTKSIDLNKIEGQVSKAGDYKLLKKDAK